LQHLLANCCLEISHPTYSSDVTPADLFLSP
jgi:hypothetical protein